MHILRRSLVACAAPSVVTGLLLASAPGTARGAQVANVDLALEFTNMVIAQRGFQANARVITVSDDMLNELVNLKR